MRARSAAGCLIAILAVACGTRREAAPRASAGAGSPDSTAATAGQWCELADTGVEAAIAAVAKQRNGDEYCEDRHYAVDEVDGDSLDDLVVTFNVEPDARDADTESYLMAFLTTREGRAPLVLRIDKVGAEGGTRYPTDVSIDGQFVVVDFSDYLPGDPDCCPSGSSTARFLVNRDSIVEQVMPGQRLPRRVPAV